MANNLSGNSGKTKDLIIHFRKHPAAPDHLHINGDRLEKASTFRFLGVQISVDLFWSANTCVTAKKALQHMYFLTVLRNNSVSPGPTKT